MGECFHFIANVVVPSIEKTPSETRYQSDGSFSDSRVTSADEESSSDDCGPQQQPPRPDDEGYCCNIDDTLEPFGDCIVSIVTTYARAGFGQELGVREID